MNKECASLLRGDEGEGEQSPEIRIQIHLRRRNRNLPDLLKNTKELGQKNRSIGSYTYDLKDEGRKMSEMGEEVKVGHPVFRANPGPKKDVSYL